MCAKRALIMAVVMVDVACAADFQFFDKGVDYWNQAKTAVKEEKEPGKKPMSAQATSSFPWTQYLDPKNKEFFKEGDYTPPEPFMELVRNPSDYNLKMWFSYMDKKNDLSENLQKRMAQYLDAHVVTADEKAYVAAKVENLKISVTDTKRYRFRMYFDSKCPHCRRMFETLVALQSQGFFVEARQIDTGEAGALPFAAARATKSEIQGKDIKSVPLLLIGDLKKKVVYRMNGYQTVSDVLKRLKAEES